MSPHGKAWQMAHKHRPTFEQLQECASKEGAWNFGAQKILLSEIEHLNQCLETVKELTIGAKTNLRINMSFDERTTPHVQGASNQLGKAIAELRKALRQ